MTEIIRQPVSSQLDLERLCSRLGIPVRIDWADNAASDPNIPQILNIDADQMGGTHWVGVYKGKYFDPFGLPPARHELEDLQWVPIQVQSLRSGGCGNYVVLWLYYLMRNNEKGFYNLF